MIVCYLFQGVGKSEEGDYCPLAILAHEEEWEGSQVLRNNSGRRSSFTTEEMVDRIRSSWVRSNEKSTKKVDPFQN